MRINVTVNAASYQREIEPRLLLVHFLRSIRRASENSS